jgi:hypothetical protein
MFCYQTSFPALVLALVSLLHQFCAHAMLLLPAENLEERGCNGIQWHNGHSKFRGYRSNSLKAERRDTRWTQIPQALASLFPSLRRELGQQEACMGVVGAGPLAGVPLQCRGSPRDVTDSENVNWPAFLNVWRQCRCYRHAVNIRSMNATPNCKGMKIWRHVMAGMKLLYATSHFSTISASCGIIVKIPQEKYCRRRNH